MNNFKKTDIYLIDQILKGNFDSYKNVLDAGCGSGRNLSWFLDNNFDVYGVDINQDAVGLASKLRNANPNNFSVSTVENMKFDFQFDLIICNAVLHFAKNKVHFENMFSNLWSNLSENGILFIRLASDIGIENLVKHIGDGNYLLPDGSTRYLVNHNMLIDYSNHYNAELVEKIKTTNMHNLRAMTTWIIRK